MTKHFSRLLLCPLALLLITVLVSAHATEQQLEVISLQHRLAVELIPNLQPFIEKEGVITATGNRLIIRTTSANLNELKTLIKQLDQPARRLLIEVRQPLSAERRDQHTKIDGDINSEIRLRTYGTSSRDSAASEQQVQVLEGHTALIKTGQSVPLVTKRLSRDGRAETVIDQQDVSSGFRVTPRLNGDTVLLEIMPFSASPASTGGGVINQQQTFTTVSIRLGEWGEIGGVRSSHQLNGSGTVYSTHGRNEQFRRILIRVTEQ